MSHPNMIHALAAYFTGPLVAENSINLNIEGRAERARQYFAVRQSLGITGYMSDDEARRAIARAIGESIADLLT